MWSMTGFYSKPCTIFKLHLPDMIHLLFDFGHLCIWVDDNLYAGILWFMLRRIAASIIALYDILGYYPSCESPDVFMGQV
jgi:hypothetical protein